MNIVKLFCLENDFFVSRRFHRLSRFNFNLNTVKSIIIKPDRFLKPVGFIRYVIVFLPRIHELFFIICVLKSALNYTNHLQKFVNLYRKNELSVINLFAIIREFMAEKIFNRSSH